MKVAIVGSRTFNDYRTAKKFIDDTCSENGIEITTIVSGGARGADAIGERYARENGIETLIFPADWKTYGKRAGFKRNHDIIYNCDVCIAFWDGLSHGTKHDIELCEQYGKKVYIHLFKNGCQNL